MIHKSKYMFTVEAPFVTRRVGQTPAGYRVDIEYRNSGLKYGGTVSTDAARLFTGWANAEDVDVAEQWMLSKKELLKLGIRQKGELATKLTQIADPQEAAAFLKVITDAIAKADDEKQTWLTDADTPWFGLQGGIVSGADWAVIREDGVIDFDGRLTLSDQRKLLVNAQIVGSVDTVAKGQPRPLSVEQAIDRLDSDDELEFGFALALRFEAAREPEPWAAKRYKRQAGQTRYIELSRGQFLGVGKMTAFGHGNAKFTMDVMKVIPQTDDKKVPT